MCFLSFFIDSETNSYYQGLNNIIYCMNLHNRMRWTGDLSNQLNSHTLSPKLPFQKDGRTGEYLMRWYSEKKYQKVSNVFRKTQTFRVYDPSSVGEKPLPGEHVSVQMMVRDKPFVFSPSSFYYKETQKNHGGWGFPARFLKPLPYFRPKSVTFPSLFQTLPVRTRLA